MIDETLVSSAESLEERFLSAFAVNEPHIRNGRGGRLTDGRRKAIRRFAEIGLPDAKSEAWKYTNISKTLRHDYRITSKPPLPKLTGSDVEPFLVPRLDAAVAVLVNGVFIPELSRVDLPGVTVTDLLDASDTDLFLDHYGRYDNDESEPFAALNTSFARGGLFIHATRSADGSRPLHIVNVSVGDEDLLIHPRHLAILDESATLTLVESHHSISTARRFSNSVFEISVARGARLDGYRVQDEGSKSSSVTNVFVYQAESSYASWATITLSGDTIRNNVSVLPDGEHCESHLVGLFLGQGELHVDNHTLVDHARPNCFSNELYKGILDDSSKGVFNGKVLVRRDAQKTNAYQSNKSIVLTDTASMNAKPELEIYADDVKCSHGATTGRQGSEALFYLRSRGLSLERARAILLIAFARDVLDVVAIEPLRTSLDATLEQRLGG